MRIIALCCESIDCGCFEAVAASRERILLGFNSVLIQVH